MCDRFKYYLYGQTCICKPVRGRQANPSTLAWGRVRGHLARFSLQIKDSVRTFTMAALVAGMPDEPERKRRKQVEQYVPTVVAFGAEKGLIGEWGCPIGRSVGRKSE